MKSMSNNGNNFVKQACQFHDDEGFKRCHQKFTQSCESQKANNALELIWEHL